MKPSTKYNENMKLKGKGQGEEIQVKGLNHLYNPLTHKKSRS